MSYVIYMHKNKTNGKVYVGQTSQEVNQRWRNGKGYVNNTLFNKAIQKYGWDNFEHIILYTGLTKSEADKIEIKMISFYESNNPKKGYNLTTGGDGTNGYRHTQEHRDRISEIQTGRKLTEEWKANIRDSVKGEKHPFYGKKFSDEHRKHLSEAHMGQVSTNGMLGKKHSEDTKKKMSESRMGRKFSDESKDKMKHSALKVRGRLFRCVELNRIFDNLNEAHDVTTCAKSAIVMCCQGKQKQSKGYHWEYVN